MKSPNDYGIGLTIHCAMRNCEILENYYQAVIFNSENLICDLQELRNILRHTHGAVIYSCNSTRLTVTNSTSSSTIEFFDLSSCCKNTFRGKKFHNIICLCPISEDVYSELAPTIVTYKGKINAAPEDKETNLPKSSQVNPDYVPPPSVKRSGITW